MDYSGVLHIHNGFHVALNEFFFDYFNNSGLGAFIQIMFGSLTFLVDTGFDFTDVGGSGIFFKKYLAFILVELRRLLEKYKFNIIKNIYCIIGCSDFVCGWVWWALAYTEFGFLFNPIPTRGGRLCPLQYYLPIRI